MTFLIATFWLQVRASTCIWRTHWIPRGRFFLPKVYYWTVDACWPSSLWTLGPWKFSTPSTTEATPSATKRNRNSARKQVSQGEDLVSKRSPVIKINPLQMRSEKAKQCGRRGRIYSYHCQMVFQCISWYHMLDVLFPTAIDFSVNPRQSHGSFAWFFVLLWWWHILATHLYFVWIIKQIQKYEMLRAEGFGNWR